MGSPRNTSTADEQSNTAKIPDFHEAIFGEFRKRTINGKPVKSKDIRQKIAQNKLPPLPGSRLDPNTPMCLAWHTKGMCNNECPHVADHIKYDASQYKPLKSWCDENYPKDS